MRLLIAEDDGRAARYLLRGLTESGHVVDHAADEETGLALTLEGIYDALIVDRWLPVLDGLALVRRLLDHDAVTPVLILSAIGSAADKVEGMRAGCDYYLAKPYAFSEVVARLEPCCWKRLGTTTSIRTATSSTCTSTGCGRRSTRGLRFR
jgi:two-component system OmpR family response regulator